eukprot:8301765-Pyramimonas_sp.AAC.1
MERRAPLPRNRFRFRVRAVRAGEAKPRGRGNGNSPVAGPRLDQKVLRPATGGARCPAGVPL